MHFRLTMQVLMKELQNSYNKYTCPQYILNHP